MNISSTDRTSFLACILAAFLSFFASGSPVMAADAGSQREAQPADSNSSHSGTPAQAIAQEHSGEEAPQQAAGRRQYLFFAVFDCSWKNVERGPQGATNARLLFEQLRSVQNERSDLHTEYLLTDCARDNWFALPLSGKDIVSKRVEHMYQRLVDQATLWRMQDPQARINVVSLGGSWGGAQAAVFAHVVDERGIRLAKHSESAKPRLGAADGVLAASGDISQALVLLDPVGATAAVAALPASVVSGFQIVARDEKREAFRSSTIIAQGASANRALLGVTVAGSHSDICGGYERNGLAIRTANLAIDYINSLSATPILQRQPLPTDPKINVIHRSDQEGS
jgi:hypothetical protein